MALAGRGYQDIAPRLRTIIAKALIALYLNIKKIVRNEPITGTAPMTGMISTNLQPIPNNSIKRDSPKLRFGFPSPVAPAAPHVKR